MFTNWTLNQLEIRFNIKLFNNVCNNKNLTILFICKALILKKSYNLFTYDERIVRTKPLEKLCCLNQNYRLHWDLQ